MATRQSMNGTVLLESSPGKYNKSIKIYAIQCVRFSSIHSMPQWWLLNGQFSKDGRTNIWVPLQVTPPDSNSTVKYLLTQTKFNRYTSESFTEIFVSFFVNIFQLIRVSRLQVRRSYLVSKTKLEMTQNLNHPQYGFTIIFSKFFSETVKLIVSET